MGEKGREVNKAEKIDDDSRDFRRQMREKTDGIIVVARILKGSKCTYMAILYI